MGRLGWQVARQLTVERQFPILHRQVRPIALAIATFEKDRAPGALALALDHELLLDELAGDRFVVGRLPTFHSWTYCWVGSASASVWR